MLRLNELDESMDVLLVTTLEGTVAEEGRESGGPWR